MNFLFAWRYFKAKKTTNAINIISWISIVAIMVGTAALILVLSVFNGFEGLVKSLYSSFYPDIRIIPAKGKQLVLTQDQITRLKSVGGINSISLVVEEKAMLVNGDYQANIYLKGVDEAYSSVTSVKDYLVRGSFDVGGAANPKLVLGAGIENAVGVQSDRNLAPLLVYTGRKGKVDVQDPLKNVSSAEANTSGTFIIQQDFDNRYAITNLSFVKTMLDMATDHYGAAEIKIINADEADDVKKVLQKSLGSAYIVQTRYQQNVSLYSVMRAEKWFIYAILSLILVVAAFNMIGALTMLVLEKKQDINVLHALGGSRSFIQNIFLSQGLLLAAIGGVIGMLLALIITLLQINFKIIPLRGSFLIDYFPVKLNITDFILVGSTVIVIAFIASWLPSRKAANQQFALRSE
jgi:lipoprotein-releasing system permease protein